MTNQDERWHALARAAQIEQDLTALRLRRELAAWIDATLKIAAFNAECGVLPAGTILQRRLKELASRVAAVDRLEGEGGLGELLQDGDAEHRFNAVRTAVLERQAQVTELAERRTGEPDGPELRALPLNIKRLTNEIRELGVDPPDDRTLRRQAKDLGGRQVRIGARLVWRWPEGAAQRAVERWSLKPRSITRPVVFGSALQESMAPDNSGQHRTSE